MKRICARFCLLLGHPDIDTDSGRFDRTDSTLLRIELGKYMMSNKKNIAANLQY